MEKGEKLRPKPSNRNALSISGKKKDKTLQTNARRRLLPTKKARRVLKAGQAARRLRKGGKAAVSFQDQPIPQAGPFKLRRLATERCHLHLLSQQSLPMTQHMTHHAAGPARTLNGTARLNDRPVVLHILDLAQVHVLMFGTKTQQHQEIFITVIAITQLARVIIPQMGSGIRHTEILSMVWIVPRVSQLIREAINFEAG
jgi:hypothetical protein